MKCVVVTVENILLAVAILTLSAQATPGVNRGDNPSENVTSSAKNPFKSLVNSSSDDPVASASDQVQSVVSDDELSAPFSGTIVTASQQGNANLPPPHAPGYRQAFASQGFSQAQAQPPLPPGGGFGGFPGAAGFTFPGGAGLPGLGAGFGFPGVGAGMGISAGIGGYLPIVEKILVMCGAGLLLLLMMAMMSGSMSRGGLLNNWGAGFSKAFGFSDHIDVGPIHKSGYANLSINKGAGVDLSHQVNQAVNRKF